MFSYKSGAFVAQLHCYLNNDETAPDSPSFDFKVCRSQPFIQDIWIFFLLQSQFYLLSPVPLQFYALSISLFSKLGNGLSLFFFFVFFPSTAFALSIIHLSSLSIVQPIPNHFLEPFYLLLMDGGDRAQFISMSKMAIIMFPSLSFIP